MNAGDKLILLSFYKLLLKPMFQLLFLTKKGYVYENSQKSRGITPLLVCLFQYGIFDVIPLVP